MGMIEREILTSLRVTQALGTNGVGALLQQLWPIWDSIMAGVLYYRGVPVFASTVAAQALEQPSRYELDLPSPAELVVQGEGMFGEECFAKRCARGRWEYVWLGEVSHPTEIAPLSNHEFDEFPSRWIDCIQLARAATTGSSNGETQLALVSPGSDVVHVAFEISQALAFDPYDHSWVPDSWRAEPVQPGYGYRFDEVTAADGERVLLRSYTFRLGQHSVFLPRLWFGEPSNEVALQVDLGNWEHSPGI